LIDWTLRPTVSPLGLPAFPLFLFYETTAAANRLLSGNGGAPITCQSRAPPPPKRTCKECRSFGGGDLD